MITIIAATSLNNIIGYDNKIPWKMGTDLQRFKDLTIGKTVIMGRKTYEHLGKPLPNRQNIVVTNNEKYTANGVTICHSIEEALDKSLNEVFIIGGGTIYSQTMDIADRLCLTIVNTKVKGDTFFPQISNDWKLMVQSFHHKGESDEYSHQYIIYTKKK